MSLVDLVATLVLLQLLVFCALVGRARVKYGVKAPAVTGHEMFERAYRVQMNTVELIVLLLPAMYLAAKYWPPAFAAAAGAVYFVGRLLYWRAYMSAPERREFAFRLSVAPVFVLLVAVLIGVARGMCERTR
ncbi:MAG: MAPEG family protein [Proteobacteria bacterium]|jgi:hypothetical protein|nr:MAG: MAPEG family protein [Pseudomonadota bacterium]